MNINASPNITDRDSRPQSLQTRLLLRTIGAWFLGGLMGLIGWELRGDDALPAPHEPAALVVVAGVDRLLEDVDYLCQVGQMPHLPQLVRGGVEGLNGLAGIDRSLPGGAMLFLDPEHPEREPVPLVFLPVNNLESFKETAQRLGLTIEPVREEPTAPSDGKGGQLYTILLDGVPHPLRVSDGYARITKPGVRAVDATPTQIRALSKPLAHQYDLAISIRREGIPAPLFQRVRAKFDADVHRALERNPEESDRVFKIRTRAQRVIFDTMLAVLEQSDGLLAGISVSPSDNGASIEVQLQTTESGDLSRWFQEISLTQHRFANVCEQDAALSLILGAQLTDEGVALGRQIVDLLRHEAERKPIPELTEAERQQVTQVLNSLQATIDARLIEGFAQFREEQGAKFIVLMGASVADPAGLRSAMQVLLPHLRQAPNVAQVEACETAGETLNLHCITPTKVRDRDTKLYGNDVALYVGTGRESSWLAVGGSSTPEKIARLEQQTPTSFVREKNQPDSVPPATNDETHKLKTPDAPQFQPSPLAKLSLHLKAWLPLATEETGRAALASELIQETFPNDQPDDQLTVTLRSTGRGLALKVHVEPGYLRLAFKAVALRKSSP